MSDPCNDQRELDCRASREFYPWTASLVLSPKLICILLAWDIVKLTAVQCLHLG